MLVCNQTWLEDALYILAFMIFWGQRSHKQVKGQMRSNVKVNLQDSITVDSFKCKFD